MKTERGWASKAVSGGVCALFAVAGPYIFAGNDQPKGEVPANAPPVFKTDIQPFFAKNCFGCHNAKMNTGGLNLQAYESADSVLEDRDKWEMVLQKLKTGEMPPKGLPRPKPADVQTVTGWIKGEFDRADSHAKPEPGRVTARRLNRAEYNNTIRDLLAVDIHPADGFPQDDSGYGFDDIGDVLSLSPVLMEKYLAAAEQVSHAALFGPPVLKPTLVRLQAGSRKIAPVYTPPTEYDLSGLSLPNAVHANYRFPVEGEYLLKIALSGSRPQGSEPVQVALWLDGRQIRSFEFDWAASGAPPTDDDQQDLTARSFEFRTKISAGEHWLAASVLHLYDGLPPAFGGPNPSKRPIPVAEFVPPKDASPERIEKLRKKWEERRSEKKRANGASVGRIDVVGPYNQVTGPDLASLKKIYVCGHLDGHHRPACARKIVSNLAHRAFRRPVSPEEVDRYMRLFQETQKNGDGFADGIDLALQAILVSPDFLFRIEHANGSSGPQSASNSHNPSLVRSSLNVPATAHPVNAYELASRLSYFLWSSMPDDELMRCGERGTLRKPEILTAQVNRMLRDPKSVALAENFGGQWLEFRALESAEPDRDLFPDFDEYLRISMQKETVLFIQSIMREDRSILDFLNGKYTFLNERLAKFYGIAGVKGPEFRRVDLSDNPERGGVLGQGSVLTVSSYATRTSPVLRGKWILENFLNDPPPPPPPGVPNLDVAEVGTSISLRQQMEKHRSNPMCASCHQRMDPMGFSLENYNAIGQWRTRDGKFDIDSAGVFPDGRSFKGPDGLKQTLLSDPDTFARCVTEKLLTYALGRGLERYDRPTVQSIVRQISGDDYRFSKLVLSIVNSLPFQMQNERTGKQGKNDDHHT